ncbi:MAG: MlaD family protein [Nocardioidaceae bacterium]
MRRAIRAHLRDFVAVALLALLALGVAGYVLAHQRFYLPAWVPLAGTDFYDVSAELETAQAVVPGQGQSVNIAGVDVGEVGRVELENGHAVVQMRIERRHAPIYRDATVLLRPKTGLKDMYLALDPGSPSAGELPEGGRVPLSRTLPDVNPDEILAKLDADTRAYLRVLLNSGGQAFAPERRTGEGLAGDGGSATAGAPTQSAAQDLREALKRFEPTARDTRALVAQLARRRRNVRRVIHNFQRLSTALAGRDRQLAELVDSTNASFAALAGEEASLSESVRLLPGALAQTETTLRKVDTLATGLGPTLERLRPAARGLGPALRETRPFLRETTPVIRTQLRPFARDVRPTVRDLRRAAERLAPVTPRLTRSLRFVNALLDTLAYNPPGREEGYLFWASWVNHAGATLFNTQDAHGPIRRGLVLISCPAFDFLDQIKLDNPQLGILVQLLGAPAKSEVCPSSTAPVAAP